MTGITANGARIHAAALEKEAAAAIRDLQALLEKVDNRHERDALKAQIRVVGEELARRKAEIGHSLF
jgi:hypothetical protein